MPPAPPAVKAPDIPVRLKPAPVADAPAFPPFPDPCNEGVLYLLGGYCTDGVPVYVWVPSDEIGSTAARPVGVKPCKCGDVSDATAVVLSAQAVAVSAIQAGWRPDEVAALITQVRGK